MRIVRNQVLEQIPVQVEDVYQSGTRAAEGQAAGAIGIGEGNIKSPAKALDIEREVGVWKVEVLKSTRQRNLLEGVIEGIDGSVREIRGIQSRANAADADRQPGVGGRVSAVIYKGNRRVIR